ncbi:MAG: MarR family transcriptional regulator, partial [Oscillospiraceae bacterium]|nr:MarR family transcriptional regulator [Oscillospiraceae bacterium]
MEQDHCAKALNDFLVEVFNDILKTEELYVSEGYSDLSVREMHLIEEVCRAVDQGRDNRSSAIAAAQGVTAGTLTAAVNQLEAKGYLERVRDSSDKRSVRLCPTQKGRE